MKRFSIPDPITYEGESVEFCQLWVEVLCKNTDTRDTKAFAVIVELNEALTDRPAMTDVTLSDEAHAALWHSMQVAKANATPKKFHSMIGWYSAVASADEVKS